MVAVLEVDDRQRRANDPESLQSLPRLFVEHPGQAVELYVVLHQAIDQPDTCDEGSKATALAVIAAALAASDQKRTAQSWPVARCPQTSCPVIPGLGQA